MTKKLLLIFAVVFTGAFIALQFYKPKPDTATVTLAGEELQVVLAISPMDKIKGLSDRESLDPWDGMLFYFNTSDRHAFVMRDMLFPIDIVWFSDGKVVDIAPNLLPDPASEINLIRYIPRANANLVLELPARWTGEHNLKIGDKLTLVEEET